MPPAAEYPDISKFGSTDGTGPSHAPVRWEFDSRRFIAALALGVAYYAGVQIGSAFTLEPNAVSTLWPPNAIVLAALLLTPVRAWPLMIAAAAPAHLAAQLPQDVPFAMSVGWYVSNMFEAVIGAAIIVKVVGATPRFDRVRDVSIFLVAGVLFAPLVSSFLDAGFIAWIGWRYSGDFWHVWQMRLLSNALANLTVVPLVVIAMTKGVASLRQARFANLAEFVILLAMLSAVCLVVFHQDYPRGQTAVYLYAPLPLLMWAAVRHGVSGVTLGVAVVAVLAITGVRRGFGPFMPTTPEYAAFSLQIFLIIAAVSLMMLAASLAELRHERAETMRRKEELKLALDAAHMGTWDWDIGSDLVSWRMQHQNVDADDGVDGAQSAMATLLERVHAEDRSLVASAITAALAHGETRDIECRFECDGAMRWIMCKGRPVLDAKGKPQRITGVCVDISERKAREYESRSQQEQLAHLGRVTMLGELSGALAHELSQPLAAIQVNANAGLQFMKTPNPDLPELQAILEDIAAEGLRAAEVIGRLRELFRKGEVEMAPVSSGECVQDVLALQRSEFIARNVMTEIRVDMDLPPVMASRVQLQQVLLNLMVNACDAMAHLEPDERRLRIASSLSAEGDVHIEVCDCGRGVENLEQIFEPFYSTKTHGIGLGLAISRTIIGAHRGRLWATNNPTVGATFHIALPAAADRWV